jgi:hypothetical protein
MLPAVNGVLNYAGTFFVPMNTYTTISEKECAE